jgi:hypothetical protein
LFAWTSYCAVVNAVRPSAETVLLPGASGFGTLVTWGSFETAVTDVATAFACAGSVSLPLVTW